MALSDITTVFSAKSDSQRPRLPNWHSYHCAINSRNTTDSAYPLHSLCIGFKETIYPTLLCYADSNYIPDSGSCKGHTRVVQGLYKGRTRVIPIYYPQAIPSVSLRKGYGMKALCRRSTGKHLKKYRRCAHRLY